MPVLLYLLIQLYNTFPKLGIFFLFCFVSFGGDLGYHIVEEEEDLFFRGVVFGFFLYLFIYLLYFV